MDIQIIIIIVFIEFICIIRFNFLGFENKQRNRRCWLCEVFIIQCEFYLRIKTKRKDYIPNMGVVI
jgi:hypothetical protein